MLWRAVGYKDTYCIVLRFICADVNKYLTRQDTPSHDYQKLNQGLLLWDNEPSTNKETSGGYSAYIYRYIYMIELHARIAECRLLMAWNLFCTRPYEHIMIKKPFQRKSGIPQGYVICRDHFFLQTVTTVQWRIYAAVRREELMRWMFSFNKVPYLFLLKPLLTAMNRALMHIRFFFKENTALQSWRISICKSFSKIFDRRMDPCL